MAWPWVGDGVDAVTTARPVVPSFSATLPLPEFVSLHSDLLIVEGFRPGEALVVTASCRDEIVAGLRSAIRARWSNFFDFSSLAGLPLAGRTGARSAVDHAPRIDGRTEVVAWAVPHIGVLADGTPGMVGRRGRSRPTTACGSLMAAAQWARDSAADPLADEAGIDPLDPEQSLVRARLRRADDHFQTLDPVSLVRLAADVIAEDLWQLLESLTSATDVDIAVVGGILVHGPDGDVVEPNGLKVRRFGEIRTLAAGEIWSPAGVSGLPR